MGRAKEESDRNARHGRRVKPDWVARVNNAGVEGDCEVIAGVNGDLIEGESKRCLVKRFLADSRLSSFPSKVKEVKQESETAVLCCELFTCAFLLPFSAILPTAAFCIESRVRILLDCFL
ncbi:hypothetical protein V6N13_146902 [Hibiscus sabdariffa]